MGVDETRVPSMLTSLGYCRRLSLALTAIVMLLSLGTTYALQYMPNDPLHIRRNLTLYSLFVVGASGAGFVGALKVAILVEMLEPELIYQAKFCAAFTLCIPSTARFDIILHTESHPPQLLDLGTELALLTFSTFDSQRRSLPSTAEPACCSTLLGEQAMSQRDVGT